jgi:protein arginine kinase activator
LVVNNVFNETGCFILRMAIQRRRQPAVRETKFYALLLMPRPVGDGAADPVGGCAGAEAGFGRGVRAGRGQPITVNRIRINMSAIKMCSVCKEKPATLFLTKISSDNKKQDLNLCDACAKAKGLDSDPTAFLVPDADIMLGLGASQELDPMAGAVEIKCSRCGFSQADFKKSGRLGCPACYETFAEGLASLLKTMHKGTRHAGKAPEAVRTSRETGDRLKQLQKKLNKAVETEDFETAANLRDEIKALSGAGPIKAIK